MASAAAAAPAANEPKSVSMIIKQRQQSRSSAVAPRAGGKNSGGAGGNPNDNLNPVLPPLFPAAPKPTQLDPEMVGAVKVYNKLSQYFKSNFSVDFARKQSSSFYVDRYTDQYKSPLALKPHLLHKVKDSRYPEELTKKNMSRKVVTRKMKRKIEDLPDDDEAEKEGSPEKQVKPKDDDEEEEEDEKEETNLDDMDEEGEDLDEEMDMGTDYALSYFDNGEGDDDDRDEDDGPTY